jgi:peptidoglycan/LPS O-acetylase OafA/YrhL
VKKDKAVDGLRGLAAVTVFFSHFLLAFFPGGLIRMHPGVAGAGATFGLAERIISIPFLSLLWNGRFSVCIFFVLSGYVLTKAYVERGDPEILRSMAVRRYFRLGIPVFFSVLLAISLMVFVGYGSETTVGLTHSAWLVSQLPPNPVSFWDAIAEGIYRSMFTLQHFYNPALWTMRIEFIGSMLIFAYRLIAWPGRRGLIAVAIYVALIVFMEPMFWPFYMAFLVGSHIGEMPRTTRPRLAFGSVILGLAVASVDNSAMFSWLHVLPLEFETTMEFYCVVGGALVLYGVRGGAFSFFLESRPVQFLGRISFPLYLVHLPILFTVGCELFNVLRVDQGLSRYAAAGLAWLVTFICILIVAWIFEVLVDAPAIRFSRRLFPGLKSGVTDRTSSAPVNR